MMNSRTLVVLLASLFIALGTACGEDSSQGNNGESNNGADAGTDTGADAEQVEVPQEWEYAAEYNLRFTSFQFERGTPGSDLNILLRSNIRDQHKKYPIVVLVHLKDIDTEAGTLAIRGGAGKKAELQCDPQLDGFCEYQWDEGTADTYTTGVPFDPATGEFDAELASLDFVATFEINGEEKDTVIPITDLTLDAALVPFAYKDDNGEVEVDVEIDGAKLVGLLTEEDADASGVQLSAGQEPKPLSEILGKNTMNYDRDDDGTMDAWELRGSFSAEETIVVE